MHSIRKHVQAGEMLVGAWLNLGSPASAEIAGLAGFPWVLIDREHGGGDERDLAMQVMAADCGGACSVVRVGQIDALEIKRALEYGAMGVMAPSVNTPEEAARVVRFVHIPPAGGRGVASSARCCRYGFGYHEYLNTANELLTVMVQIESRDAVENCAAIAAVEGVDVLFVGPTDLSVSLDLRPGAESSVLDECFRRVSEVARETGKAAGILARDPEQVKRYTAMGYTVISVASDRGLLASGFRHALDPFR